MFFKNIDKSEKKVIYIALSVSTIHLLLIAIAVAYFRIDVPTCQPQEKLFDKGSIRTVAPKRVEVQYLAKMWNFEPRRIVIPIGTTVEFFLGSLDVIHGFHIYKTNINLMAVPGVINKAIHTFNKPGIFHIVCHEYCGTGHQNMHAQIEVSETATSATSDLDVAATGVQPIDEAARKLYEAKGCIACHTLDGNPGVGPTLIGIFNQNVTLEDGSSVLVDESYLRESIKQPTAKLVKGYAPTMPILPLTDDEINILIEFIKNLK